MHLELCLSSNLVYKQYPVKSQKDSGSKAKQLAILKEAQAYE